MRTIMAHGQERPLNSTAETAVSGTTPRSNNVPVVTLLCRDDPGLTLHNYTWRPSNSINHEVSKLKSYICPSPRPTWVTWHVIPNWSVTSTVLHNKTDWRTDGFSYSLKFIYVRPEPNRSVRM
jgi:hypothetical protein